MGQSVKLLAIDTATEQVSVAVGDAHRVDAALHVASDRRHVEALVPAIQLLLGNLGISVHELSAIAVDVGPGLFTGMRVGLTTAQTLADLAEIPVVGIDSLSVVAHGALAVSPVDVDDADIVVPILDARRSQVYWSMHRNNFSTTNTLEEVRRPRVGDVGELLEDVMDRGQRALIVGTGANRYAEQLASCPETVRMGDRSGSTAFPFDPHVPHASVLLRLAAARVETGAVINAVEPLYLRPPDAEINWVTR
jgi:tRNA threonylcarbamoyladenosine biosynthesis protein TsaB